MAISKRLLIHRPFATLTQGAEFAEDFSPPARFVRLLESGGIACPALEPSPQCRATRDRRLFSASFAADPSVDDGCPGLLTTGREWAVNRIPLYVFRVIWYHGLMSVDLSPIEELYRLWKPVYPYLVKEVEEIAGHRGGAVLEVGPFCGAIFALHAERIGDSYAMATFPPEMATFFAEQAKLLGVDQAVRIISSDASLRGVEDSSVDLLLFRGALFFPALFRINFTAIYRVLKENGVALVGGGFGKYTPQGVIASIGKRSRELNLLAGKVEVTEAEIREAVRSEGVPGDIEIISEGGLWVIMRK